MASLHLPFLRIPNARLLLLFVILMVALITTAMQSLSQQSPPTTGQRQPVDVQRDDSINRQIKTGKQSEPPNATMPPTKQNPTSKTKRSTNHANNKQRVKEADNGWSGWVRNPATAFNALLVLLTAVLAVSTALLWWETRNLRRAATTQAEDFRGSLAIAKRSAAAAERAAKVADASLIATQRPWVTIDIKPGGPLKYNVNGLNVSLDITLTNIGNSPATNVWVSGRIIAPAIGVDKGPDFDALRREEITKAKSAGLVPYGHTIFRGRAIVQNYTWSVPKDEISRITQTVDFVHLTLVGAVTYGSALPHDDEVHVTLFGVDIQRSNSPRPEAAAKNRNPGGIFPDEGDIPANELHLVKSFMLSDYAD